MSQASIRRYLKHGTLPQLRVFEASVRLGSLARAAEELHIAAPTASVQIRKLSETVGSPLFEQLGKRMYPTEAGRRVFEGCNEVFRALGSLDDALAGLRVPGAGELRLAAATSARHFAPRLLGAFLEQYPTARTSLHIGNAVALEERMRHNDDDLYLVADPPPDANLVVQALLANPLVVMARQGHPLAHARAVPFERIAQEPFLVRERGSATRAAAIAAFARHGFAPRIRMELESNEAIREAILAGIGISILPRHAFGAEPETPGLVCLDADGFPLESHWHLAYSVGKELSPAARAFLELARTEGRRIASRLP